MREIPFGRPIIGEEERNAVMDVLQNPVLVHGPRTTAFESAFAAWTGAPHAVAVSSCTAAMHLVYFTVGIGVGDEVIVPAQTHTATAHSVELTGAKAVFVDAESRWGNIDIDAIEAKITAHTRAIAVVHFLGVPVEMPRVVALAEKYGLLVVEDCALAIGTRIGAVHAGLFGHVGCFSFYPVKHITTAEGGMILTRDDGLAAKLRHLRAFGVDRHVGERPIPGIYDVTALGFNYRMNEIEAAIGIEQVKRLDAILDRRADNEAALRQELGENEHLDLFQSPPTGYMSSHYCFGVRLRDSVARRRFDVMERLKARGVGSSIYYPRPVPLMTYYRKKYGHTDGEFPVASAISERTISLPVGPHLSTGDMGYIAESLRVSLREVL